MRVKQPRVKRIRVKRQTVKNATVLAAGLGLLACPSRRGRPRNCQT